jgi:Skp family chaperone for outer membrane proteins
MFTTRSLGTTYRGNINLSKEYIAMPRIKIRSNMPGILLVLALGTVVTLSRAAVAQATNPPVTRSAVPTGARHGAVVPLEMMKQSLKLSDEQAKKLEPVLKEQQEKLSALRRDTSLSRKDRVAKLKELQQSTDTKINARLAPEQAEKWQKMRLGQGQTFQARGQSSANTNMFSFGPQAGKAQQGLPTWRSRIPQPQQAQPQSIQQGTSK